MIRYENRIYIDEKDKEVKPIAAINELLREMKACYQKSSMTEADFYNKRKDYIWGYCRAVMCIDRNYLKIFASILEECIEKTKYNEVASFLAAILYSTYRCMITKELSDLAFDAFIRLKNHYLRMYMTPETHKKGLAVAKFFCMANIHYPDFELPGIPNTPSYRLKTLEDHLERVRLDHLDKNSDDLCKVPDNYNDEEYLETSIWYAISNYECRLALLPLSKDKREYLNHYNNLSREYNDNLRKLDKFTVRENMIKAEEIAEKCIEKDEHGFDNMIAPMYAYEYAVFAQNTALKKEVQNSIIEGEATEELKEQFKKISSTRSIRKARLPLLYPLRTIAGMAVLLFIIGKLLGINILGAVATKSIPYILEHPIAGALFVILPLYLLYKLINKFVTPWEYEEPTTIACVAPSRSSGSHTCRPRHNTRPHYHHQTFETDYINGFDSRAYLKERGIGFRDDQLDALVSYKMTEESLNDRW